MSIKTISLTIATCLIFAIPLAAQAGRFGDAGTVVPSGLLAADRVSMNPPEGDTKTATSLLLAPTLQYFVIDNVAIGGSMEFSHRSESDSDRTESGLGANAIIGFNIVLLDTVSLFPQVALGWNRNKYDMEIGRLMDEVSITTLNAGIYMPVLFHFGNFFLGAGPRFSTDVSSKIKFGEADSSDASKGTQIGLMTTFGGFI